ncbi:MAG: GNAT family N-acetyltransferase [Anaerolineaceae bacterium]|nr:GNAT family N-acetyltransferase [Anaerolineaceae bacterium]
MTRNTPGIGEPVITLIPFDKAYLPAAAKMFVRNFRELRGRVPDLPDGMEESGKVTGYLEWIMTQGPGVMALDGERLAGFLGWMIVDGFRNTTHRAAFCPEWSHGAEGLDRAAIYRALYRAASAEWARQGCHTHALTILAHDEEAIQTWFWNGFGMSVVDAIRPMDVLENAVPQGLIVRKATLEDVEALAVLEAEHWQHYPQPPLFMAPQQPDGAEEFRAFLAEPANAVWVAWDGERPAGHMRFQGQSEGAAAIVNAPDKTAITGAFVRPEYRGRNKAAPALLDAALRDYAAKGYRRCSVDFESFNPEAAVFWMKYFQPVCYSLMRVPEALP